jgi:[protein-PII] uridylyltransferase
VTAESVSAPRIQPRDLVTSAEIELGRPPDLPVLPSPETDAPLGSIARSYLDETREMVCAWHDAGASGRAVVEVLTYATDRLIEFLYEAATAHYRRRYVQLDQRCTLIAQGGYGRGELNPYSDIDLIFIYPHKITPYVETITETVLYSLFDARMQVGHAVRTVRDCVRLSASDFKIKTALVDARFLCGDRPLADEFFRTLERDIKARAPGRFFREKLLESKARHHAYGDSVYLLEPHLKEGQGGLRDLHTALWIAKIKFKVSSLRELAVKGVVNSRELDGIEAAQDFLFRVRNALHFLSRGHQDQLTFDFQAKVAENLHYRPRPGDDLKPVEHFLRDYYLKALAVTRFSEIIIDRSVNPPQPVRLIGRMMARTIRPGVRIVAGELNVTDGELFERDPLELVRIFVDAQRHGVQLAPGLADLVRANAHQIGEEQRESAELAELFLTILRAPALVYETLNEMHRLGVLSRVLPEWEHLLCLVLHDHYHIYTVDQHSLMAVRELERLRSREREAELPLLTQLMREVDRVELLYLGLLLHDSGKGLGGGHSEKGALFAREISRRLRLNEDDAGEVEQLVRQHLVMSHLAQRRDIHDDRLVIEFARLVGSPNALQRLYLLTYADMRATGPTVWNSWKAMLLDEAYLRVQEVFARGFEPEDREKRIERICSRVSAAAAEKGADLPQLDAFLAGMPDSYFLTTPEALIPGHAHLAQRARREGLATELTHHPGFGFSEFTVATRDREGLFAILTGVIAANGMNILAARVATSTDGMALDAFRISHIENERALDEDRWIRTRQLLADVLEGRQDLARVIARVSRPGILDRPEIPGIPREVIVDNAASEEYTVVDVYAPDRIGLLHRLAQAIFELGLRIHIAKITTNVDQILDVFYVTEADGSKSERSAEIRSALLAALEPPAKPPVGAEPTEAGAGSAP